MTYESISIIALLIHLIVNHDVLKKETGKDVIPAHMKYRSFLISLMIYYLSDALWGILYDQNLIVATFSRWRCRCCCGRAT